MFTTVRTLARSFSTWLRGGRIRASPLDGMIFRITPPAVILTNEGAIEVVGRRGREESNGDGLSTGSEIVYDCVSAGQPCALRASPASRVMILLKAGREIVLTDGDVEIFIPRG